MELNILVMVTAVSLGYYILRSMGGHGVSIEFAVDPKGTKKGDYQRRQILSVMLLVAGAIVFIGVHGEGFSIIRTLLISMFFTIPATYAAYLKYKK